MAGNGKRSGPLDGAAPADAAAGGEAAAAGAATILVVDDEVLVRETLADLLEAEGYTVIATATGDRIEEVLAPVDLVLLDAMLPGQDGWDVCRAIKAADPMLPVLMVTARTSPRDVIRTFAAGADDYIAKPFNAAELSARISTRLRVHRAEKELQAANARLRQLADQNYSLYQRARADAEERDDLLRELDHRVRNNLSVILGLVTMERNRRPVRAAAGTLLSLENRLRAFVAVHESFRRRGYAGVLASEIVDGVAERLKAVFDPADCVHLEVHCAELALNERQAFALALILNELVTNGLQHAFPGGRGGTIRIGLRSSTDREAARLEVCDDGVGIQAGIASHALGSGRSIIEALATAELGGGVTFDALECGTRAIVTFAPEPIDERAEATARGRRQEAARTAPRTASK